MAKNAILFFGILLAFQSLTVSTHGQSSGLPIFQEADQHNQVIHEPAEYDAYIGAINTQEPAQRAVLLEGFVKTYPQSVVKVEALESLMAAYQQAGNSEKAELAADKILAINHDHLRALLISAYSKRNRAKSLSDPAQRLALAQTARTLAERGLKLLVKASSPHGVSREEFDKLKKQMAAIFNGVAGFGALQNKEFVQARQYYLKADLTDVESVYQLGYVELEMEPLDVAGFWYIVRAANLAQAQNNPAMAGQIELYGKAKYRQYHGSIDGWDEVLHRFRSSEHPENPPGGFTVSRYQPPAPQRAHPMPSPINSRNAGLDLNHDRDHAPKLSPCEPSAADLRRVERSTPGGVPASTTSFGSDGRAHGVPASVASPVSGQSHGIPASVTSLGTDCLPNGVPASITSFSAGGPHGVPASVTSPVDGKSHGVPASIASPVEGKPHGVPASVTSIGVDGRLHGIPASVVSPTPAAPLLRVMFGDPHVRRAAVVPIFGRHQGPKIAALKRPAAKSASLKSLSPKHSGANSSSGVQALAGR